MVKLNFRQAADKSIILQSIAFWLIFLVLGVASLFGGKNKFSLPPYLFFGIVIIYAIYFSYDFFHHVIILDDTINVNYLFPRKNKNEFYSIRGSSSARVCVNNIKNIQVVTSDSFRNEIKGSNYTKIACSTGDNMVKIETKAPLSKTSVFALSNNVDTIYFNIANPVEFVALIKQKMASTNKVLP